MIKLFNIVDSYRIEGNMKRILKLVTIRHFTTDEQWIVYKNEMNKYAKIDWGLLESKGLFFLQNHYPGEIVFTKYELKNE